MRAIILIVHANDGLLRALVKLFVQERYEVRSAETIGGLGDLTAAARPAVLVIDEDAAGPHWQEQLERTAADVPRVLLTWSPGASLPPGVRSLRKPFRARELLDAVSESAAAGASGDPAGSR